MQIGIIIEKPRDILYFLLQNHEHLNRGYMLQIDANWIQNTINNSQEVKVQNESERNLIGQLIDCSYQFANDRSSDIGQYLAASFDLVVSADYYSEIAHTNWLYCPGAKDEVLPRLYYHFTNCCPSHVLRSEFFFNAANKPPSGKIGKSTSRLLLDFLQQLFEKRGRSEKIFKGSEPVDTVILDEVNKRVIFAEIKASPLVTLPLTILAETMYTEKDGQRVMLPHAPTNNTSLLDKEIQLLVPVMTDGRWLPRYYTLGKIGTARNTTWAQEGMTQLLKNQEFLKDYFSFWLEAIRIYSVKDQVPIFWLTNACGTPSPLPVNWAKRRVGAGYESVSDTKTSVGMDRTDDIKKGIFQTLKLGSHGKPFQSDWLFRVALISNIHAARHFDDYLDSIKDIVWTLDVSGNAKKASDLPPDQDIYNLCDGIVALTSTLSRDQWVRDLFTF